MRLLFFLGVLGLAVGCGSEPAFQCQSNDQCGVGGLCEDNGYCTFEDPDCPSGRRYGSLASDGLAGTCVDVEGGGTSAGATTSAADGSGSGSGLTADDGSESDETGETADCGAGPGSLCQAAPPEGWSGPVLAVTGSGSAEPPACPGATSQVLAANADLSANPASCTCECATNSADCGEVDILLDQVDPDGCNQPGGDGQAFQLAAGTCQTPPFEVDEELPLSLWVSWFGGGEEPGCQPQESFELPEPTWSTALAGCEPDAPAAGSCDDGATCLPAPDSGQSTAACIYRDGDMTCPLGGYTEQFTFFRSVDDARACDPCSCGPGVVRPQQCELRVYPDPMCGGDFALGIWLSPDGSSCESFDANLLGAFELVAAETGLCDPSGGAPTGEVSPSDPITVCCAS